MRSFTGNRMSYLWVAIWVFGLPTLASSAVAVPSQLVIKSAVENPAMQSHSLVAKDDATAETKVEDSKKEEDEDEAQDEAQDSDESPTKQASSESSKESETDKDEASEDSADEKSEKKADKDKKPAAKSGKSKKKEEKKPKPHKVKLGKLKIEVELDGIFVADEMEEVALRPEVWSRFKVLEAVEHGTTVKKGEVLVRFDDEKLEEDLKEEALGQSIGQLSLTQEEEEFPRLKRLMELSFEEAERRYEQTKADYEYYHETDRPISVQIAHFRYKSATEQLASAQEELDQLKKMYEADEVTEETEEIVLRRQRFTVETAELVLELNEESRDYTLNVSLPRADEYYETELEATELAYQQAKTARDIGMTRKSYDMEKKRNARAKSVRRHGKLLNDKGLMVVRAPCDGVVYYGKCSSGKWSQITTMKAKLKPFGSATANTVLMTIVKPGALHIETSLAEKNLPDVLAGLKATIIPAADKEQELEGKVARVGSIPGASNKFEVELEVDLSESPEWLVAGMTCKAKVVVYEKKEALVIPLDLVQADEDNEKIKYVMLVDPEEDEPVRRKVKLGRKKDKTVEVLKGLEEGDEIIKEEKKKDDNK